VNALSRGMRNAFRNLIRTFSIVLILGLSIGLALAMVVARQTVQNKITSVKSSIGNTITVSPAGARGFEGGGEPLNNDQMKQVAGLANVTNVTSTLGDRLTSSDTNLASAIDAGTLGNRQAGRSGVNFVPPPNNANQRSTNGSNQQVTRTFTPPVTITGTNNVSDASAVGGTSINITSGQSIDITKDENVAMVGKSLATKNSLVPGSTFKAYGTDIKVAAIFDAGNDFANNALIVSLPTLQRLSSQPGSITNAIVTVNSIDNIDSTVTSIKSALGSKADVVSNQDTAKQAIQPLESVKTISLFSLLGALVAGAVIILLTMIMIVRERRREIGVFKAIGASNVKIMLQFISEAVTLTLLGMIAGLIIGSVAANPITKVLVNNSSNSTQTTQQANGQRGGGNFRALRGIGGNSIANARNIEASVGWNIIGYGVGTALAIAIVGSALPTFLISKVRPAEVMRAE
jgi:putative ABC transport system permease protein